MTPIKNFNFKPQKRSPAPLVYRKGVRGSNRKFGAFTHALLVEPQTLSTKGGKSPFTPLGAGQDTEERYRQDGGWSCI